MRQHHLTFGPWRLAGRTVCVALASAAFNATIAQAQTTAPVAPATAVSQPALVIPDRLADSTYWRMITEFSEPSGYFTSENFVSNETSWQMVIPPLLSAIKPGGVYLGVGPEQNFTYIVAFKPKIAFITDIRRQNLLQHMWYKAVIEMSNDRADFLSRLFGRVRPPGLDTAATADALITAYERAAPDSARFKNTYDAVRDLLVTKHGFKLSTDDLASLYHVDSAFYFAGTALNYSFGQGRSGNFGGGGGYGRMMPTFAELMRADDGTGLNRSFIGNEENYRALRDLQQRNLIVPLVGNFAGDKALAAVGNWVRARNATVSTFYLSNVEQYLFRQGDEWSRFYTNVGKLPLDANSTFIRSATNRGGYPLPNGASRGGLMVQLVASMQELVQAFKEGKVTQYGDVLNLSR
ncbi:MAG: hypothetical protein ABI120_14445 [Gemmatimonadaceae bacterium]